MLSVKHQDSFSINHFIFKTFQSHVVFHKSAQKVKPEEYLFREINSSFFCLI